MNNVPTKPVTFSIVIDNYNYARFLPEAIDSCLAQSYPAHEIIVVDDGSTDNSQEVLQRYRNIPRVHVIVQHNQGQAAALQRGIDYATGDWIFGLDSDDYYLPNCLEEVSRRIDESVDWVYFRASAVDTERNRFGSRPDPKRPLLQGTIWKQWILNGKDSNFPPQSFHCYSTRFLRTVRLYPNQDVSLKSAINGDRYLNLLASFDCKAVVIESELGCYREHSSDYKSFATTFAGIRVRIQQQIVAEKIVARKLSALGISTQPRFCVYSAYDYWPQRLISLIYDPAGHPNQGDSRVLLFFRVLATFLRNRPIRPLGLVRAFFHYGAIALTPRELAWKIFQLPPPRRIVATFLDRRRRPQVKSLHH